MCAAVKEALVVEDGHVSAIVPLLILLCKMVTRNKQCSGHQIDKMIFFLAALRTNSTTHSFPGLSKIMALTGNIL